MVQGYDVRLTRSPDCVLSTRKVSSWNLDGGMGFFFLVCLGGGGGWGGGKGGGGGGSAAT